MFGEHMHGPRPWKWQSGNTSRHPEVGIPSNLNGAVVMYGMKVLYGSGYQYQYSQTPSTSDQDMWATWNKVTTRPTVFVTLNEKLPSDLISNHAYTGISCDQNAGTFTLRNPGDSCHKR